MDFEDNVSTYSNQSNPQKRPRKSVKKEKLPELGGRTTPLEGNRSSSSRNMLRSLTDNKKNGQFGLKKFSMRPQANQLTQADQDIQPNKFQISRDVDKEIGSLQINQRMRDLEKMFLDFKGNMERRISNYFTENPATLKQQFKAMEDKEQQLWQENFQKQNKIQESYNQMQVHLKKTQDKSNDNLLDMQKKVDQMEIKNHRLEKAMEGIIMKLKSTTEYQNQALALTQAPPSGTGNNQVALPPNANRGDDFGLVREHVNSELKSWQNQIEELNKNYKDLHERMYRNERDLHSKILKQKDQILEDNKTTKKQIQELEGLKMEKLLGENEYLKNLITGLERRIDDEIDKRLKQDYEGKGYLEQKMVTFKEEIRNDEKQILLNEQKFVQQFHESINNLNQIVKFTREELEANLASTQTLFSENVRNMNKTLEIVKDNMYKKVGQLEKNDKELNMRMNDTRQQFQEHATTVNNSLEKQNNRIEDLNQQLKNQLESDLTNQNLKISKFQKENEEWQEQFEKKNLQIFGEVSNALKGLKLELQKEKQRSLDRDKDIRNELTAFQTKNEKIIQNLADHTKYKDEQLEFMIQDKYDLSNKNLEAAIEQTEEKLIQTSEATFFRSQQDAQDKVGKMNQTLTENFTEQLNTESTQINRSINKLNDELSVTINETQKTLQNNIRNLEDDSNNKFQQQFSELSKMKDNLRQFKTQQQTELRKTKDEVTDNMYRTRRDLEKDTDDKVLQEKKRADQNLAKVEMTLTRRHDALAAKSAEDLRNTKADLLDKFQTIFQETFVTKLTGLINKEKKERIARDQEIEASLQSNKNMLLENIQQKVESAKSLARALVNEEAAERAKAVEELLKYTREQIDVLDKTLRHLLETSIEECKFELRKEIKALETALNDFKSMALKEFQDLHQTDENNHTFLQNEIYTRDLYQQLRQEELEALTKSIEVEIFNIKNTREKDLLILVKEIELRECQIKEIEAKFDSHSSNFQYQQNLIEDQQQQHSELKQEVFKNVTRIDKDISETREIINMYQKDTEQRFIIFKKKMDDDFAHFESQAFSDKIFNQIKFEETKTIVQGAAANINEITIRIQEFEGDLKSLYKLQQCTFENFRVADSAIKAHEKYINNLDARMTFDDLANKANFQDQYTKIQEVHKEFTLKDAAQTAAALAMVAAARQESINNLDLLKQKTEDMNSELEKNLIENMRVQQEENDEKFEGLKQQTEDEVKKFFDAKEVQEQELIENQEKLMNQLREEQQEKIDEIKEEQEKIKQEQDKNLEQLQVLTEVVEENKQNTDNQLEELKEKMEEKFQEQEQDFNKNLQEIKEKAENDLVEQKKETEEQLQFFREKQEEFDDKIRKELEEQKQEQQEIKNELETKISESTEATENKFKELKEDIEKDNEQRDKKTQEQVEELENKIKEQDEKLEDKVAEIELAQNQMKNVQDDQIKEQTDKLEQKLQEQINNQQESLDDFQKQIENKFNATNDQIRKLDDELNDEMEKQQNGFNQQLEQQNQDHEKEINELKQQLQNNEEQQKEELDKLKQNYDQEIDEMKSQQKEQKAQGSQELESVINQLKEENQQEHEDFEKRIKENLQKIQDLDEKIEDQEKLNIDQQATNSKELEKKMQEMEEKQNQKNKETIENQLEALKKIENLEKQSDDTRERLGKLENDVENFQEDTKNNFIAAENNVSKAKKDFKEDVRIFQEDINKRCDEMEDGLGSKIDENRADNIKANKELSREIKSNNKNLEDKIWNVKSEQKEQNEKFRKDIDGLSYNFDKHKLLIDDTYRKSEDTYKKTERLSDDYIKQHDDLEQAKKDIAKLQEKVKELED